MTAFPQLFMANQDILFEDMAKAYNEDPSRYTRNLQQTLTGIPGMGAGMAEVGGEAPPAGKAPLSREGLSPLPPLPPTGRRATP